MIFAWNKTICFPFFGDAGCAEWGQLPTEQFIWKRYHNMLYACSVCKPMRITRPSKLIAEAEAAVLNLFSHLNTTLFSISNWDWFFFLQVYSSVCLSSYLKWEKWHSQHSQNLINSVFIKKKFWIFFIFNFFFDSQKSHKVLDFGRTRKKMGGTVIRYRIQHFR